VEHLIEVNMKEVHPRKYATKDDHWVEAVCQGFSEGHYYKVLLVHGEHRGREVEVASWGTRRAIPMVLKEIKELANRLCDILKKNKGRLEERTSLNNITNYLEILQDITNVEEKLDVQSTNAGANLPK